MPFITQGKTNLKYILIVVILAVIVGGGILSYYYSWIKELETKLTEMELRLPEVKPSEDETANWKTYTNTSYGYQLKYPQILSTKIPENAPQVFIIYFIDNGEYLEVEISGISSLGVNKEIEFDMQRANPTKTNFLNKPALSIRPARNIYPGEPFRALIIYLEDKKLKIELGYYGDGKNEALFDQILSTFKLLAISKKEESQGVEKDKNCQFVSEEEFPSRAVPSDMDKIVIDPKSNSKIISNEVMVSFVEGTSVNGINSIVCDIDGVIIGAIPELGFFQIEIPDTGDSKGVYLAIEKLKGHPEVEVAEPNGVME